MSISSSPPPLHSILAEAKNLSFNATAAFNAYSNIKANVDAAEKEAKAAKQRASEALALVRGRALSRMETHAVFAVLALYSATVDTKHKQFSNPDHESVLSAQKIVCVCLCVCRMQ